MFFISDQATKAQEQIKVFMIELELVSVFFLHFQLLGFRACSNAKGLWKRHWQISLFLFVMLNFGGPVSSNY